MRPLLVTAILIALTMWFAPAADARGGSKSSPSKTSHGIEAPKVSSPKIRCASCPRDTKGRITRSATAKRAFQKAHPCPSTGKTTGACPGYVIDHVVPLKRGGADTPSNMAWQTVAAAKAKNRVE